VALAKALQTVSYGRLMRQSDWCGQTLLESAFCPLFVWERPYLSIDETVIPSNTRLRSSVKFDVPIQHEKERGKILLFERNLVHDLEGYHQKNGMDEEKRVRWKR
jgi:hypothetical protein